MHVKSENPKALELATEKIKTFDRYFGYFLLQNLSFTLCNRH